MGDHFYFTKLVGPHSFFEYHNWDTSYMSKSVNNSLVNEYRERTSGKEKEVRSQRPKAEGKMKKTISFAK